MQHPRPNTIWNRLAATPPQGVHHVSPADEKLVATIRAELPHMGERGFSTTARNVTDRRHIA